MSALKNWKPLWNDFLKRLSGFSFQCAFVWNIVSLCIPLPESVGALQPISKSIELILLWKRWEPEPWQPSATISVGRELAGDMHACMQTHTHTQEHIYTHTQYKNKSISVCLLTNRVHLDPKRYRCSFISFVDWIHGFYLSPTKGCVKCWELILLKTALQLINTLFSLVSDARMIIVLILIVYICHVSWFPQHSSFKIEARMIKMIEILCLSHTYGLVLYKPSQKHIEQALVYFYVK